MKTWLISLPLVCVLGIAMAEDVDKAGTANEAVADSAQKAGPKHPPRGDLRHCLDLKTNEAIIRCSEQKPKKK